MKINTEENSNEGRAELERLAALLEKYINDRCTEEEQRAIEAWYETLSGAREPKVSEELAAKERIWAGIRRSDFSPDRAREGSIRPQRQWLAWAASVLLLCMSSLVAYLYLQTREQDSLASLTGSDWTVMSNSTDSDMHLQLPDKSRITLKPESILAYPKSFNTAERLVNLEGEAFFEIEKDVTRPFKVVTGDITTRVLGTSFNVKAIDEQSVIEVDVRTGKVSVYEHSASDLRNTEGVVLTPNEKVTYYKNENRWVAELVKDPLPVTKNTHETSLLVFRDESMRNVLDRIASIYGIEIIVVNDAIYDCPFTGDVSQMELYDMLRLICKSIRSEYEVRGTRILIDGAGCPK